jgi:ergothioneine biosynthesis protein EgtB
MPPAPLATASKADEPRARWRAAFRAVREETERRAAPLSPEDQVIQSMPDASPAKWHRAHTTWFFEQFLLKPNVPNYRLFDERFAFLFNSYYVAAGPRHARPQRGLITRPNGAEVAAYRAHVDAAVERLIDEAKTAALPEILRVLEIGLHHEEQHQELMLTDILHAFSLNPTLPAYAPDWTDHNRPDPGITLVKAHDYALLEGGIYSVGHDRAGYCFDNELPVHQTLIQPVRIARTLVTNREWLEFMRDGGYEKPALWLSDAWAAVMTEQWRAPLYWQERDGEWSAFGLGGLRRVDPEAPVRHVSYYEADAFARWAGKFLPTEFEWEVAARSNQLADAYGIVWQWTRSAYLPYPGYRAAEGALGEYNGKFMVNQMVLRGSSLATPAGHSRASYRNFFYPPHRWQFAGLRLVDYA